MKFPIVYPEVRAVIDPHLSSNGKFIGCAPQGVSIHYTADRDLKRTIATLHARKLAYHLIIERDGKITQMAYLDCKVSHAGPSSWAGLSCNGWHAAVSLVSWGEVKKKGADFEAWNGVLIPAADVAFRPDNIKKVKSFWDKATPEQEHTLLEVLSWFISKGIQSTRICGHDEAAVPPGRKIDPGGVLQWSMEDLRTMLKVKRI